MKLDHSEPSSQHIKPQTSKISGCAASYFLILTSHFSFSFLLLQLKLAHSPMSLAVTLTALPSMSLFAVAPFFLLPCAWRVLPPTFCRFFLHNWASQEINQDYGEDILVQTKVGDRIDPHRLWIQVKGTRSIDRFRRRNDDLVYEVSIEHVFKWIRSPDLVIFILFDVERDCGYYTLPVEQVDLWDLYGTQKKRFGIRISNDAVFDQKKAQQISWNARIEYFCAMFVVAEQKYAQVLQDRTLDSNYLPSFKNKGPLIAYEFLRTIGFLNDGKIDELFAAQFAACKRDFRTKDVEASDREIVGRAALLCFLGLVDRVTLGCGIPQPLLNAAINIGLQLMNQYHSDTYLISPA